MAFVVETGAGTPGANSYAALSFATAYLTDRGRLLENSWSAVGALAQRAALVKATSYLDARFGPRFKGVRQRRYVAGREALGTLTFSGLPADGDTVTAGQKTYRFVDTLAAENDVLRGAGVAESIANLKSAFVGAEAGVTVEATTRASLEVSGLDPLDGATLTVQALARGEGGNSIPLATTGGIVTASGTELTGGLDEGPQPLEWPREAAYSRNGFQFYGIPLPVRQAVVEYAVRSLAATLAADPTTDARGGVVQRIREKVGPIDTEVEYVAGGVTSVAKYPAADALLADLLTSVSGAIR